ncbi:MAG: NnrS family protein [Arcobacteraceae bacterium]
MFKNWYEKFSAQPHQPFFANGIILFMAFMGLLFLSYSNVISVHTSVMTFHAYAFIFVLFIQFFLGFLFVVFPRFLIQANIEPKVYMQQFFLYFIGSYIFLIALFLSSNLYFIGLLLVFIAQILSFKTLYAIYKNSIVKDKYDTKWVLIGFATGLIAHAIFLISLLDLSHSNFLQQFAIHAGFYLFLFIIIFAISQRMIPFFTSMKVAGYNINKSKNLMEKVYGLLLLKLFLLTIGEPKLYFLADIPLFLFFAYELYKWKLPVFKTSAIMWVLFISLYWIPLGFLIASLESLSAIFNWGIVFEKASLHTFAVGYFLTVLIGFGTRVVLGHSGQTPHADKIAIAMFIFIQLVVLVRLFASFSLNFSLDYIFWINHSALLLVLALLAWSVKYLHILIKGFKPNH